MRKEAIMAYLRH